MDDRFSWTNQKEIPALGYSFKSNITVSGEPHVAVRQISFSPFYKKMRLKFSYPRGLTL